MAGCAYVVRGNGDKCVCDWTSDTGSDCSHVRHRYFPRGLWYDVSEGFDRVSGAVDARDGGRFETMVTPLDTIGVHMRAGRCVFCSPLAMVQARGACRAKLALSPLLTALARMARKHRVHGKLKWALCLACKFSLPTRVCLPGIALIRRCRARSRPGASLHLPSILTTRAHTQSYTHASTQCGSAAQAAADTERDAVHAADGVCGPGRARHRQRYPLV